MKNKELRILIRALAIGCVIAALIVLGMSVRLTLLGMVTPRWLLILLAIFGPGGLMTCFIIVLCQELKKAWDKKEIDFDADVTYDV